MRSLGRALNNMACVLSKWGSLEIDTYPGRMPCEHEEVISEDRSLEQKVPHSPRKEEPILPTPPFCASSLQTVR